MAKQTFTSGQTLTAQQVNDLQSNDFNMAVTTGTANYTLVVGDRGQRRVQNMGAAGTVTVPNSVFTAGDALWIHSIGSGTQSVVAGAGLTLNSSAGTAPTLAQWEGGVVYFTSSSSAIFFRGGSTSTLSIEYLLVGGGGGGTSVGGGGGGGGFRTATDLIAKGNTYTVTVGAGGAFGSQDDSQNGTASSFIRAANGGGAGRGMIGGSGGGYRFNAVAGGVGISGEGNNGGQGNGSGVGAGGGGGGAGGVGGNATGASGGGAGGAGSTNNYDGTSRTYSAGGGGGGGTSGGAAGDATSGAGAGGASNAGAATANRGGGGGGTYTGTATAGGSGRVILRALTADLSKFTVTTTGTPTTAVDGSYTYYAYNSTGSFRID